MNPLAFLISFSSAKFSFRPFECRLLNETNPDIKFQLVDPGYKYAEPGLAFHPGHGQCTQHLGWLVQISLPFAPLLCPLFPHWLWNLLYMETEPYQRHWQDCCRCVGKEEGTDAKQEVTNHDRMWKKTSNKNHWNLYCITHWQESYGQPTRNNKKFLLNLPTWMLRFLIVARQWTLRTTIIWFGSRTEPHTWTPELVGRKIMLGKFPS